MNEKESDRKLLTGMLILGLSGILLGMAVGYIASQAILKETVLSQLKQDGYVLTSDCDATSEDILEGKTAYVNGQLVIGTRKTIDTEEANATSDKILEGKTAYVNGKLVTGTLPLYTSKTIMPTTTASSIPSGVYINENIVIAGDHNLLSENIKKGTIIFNIRGSYRPQGNTQED